MNISNHVKTYKVIDLVTGQKILIDSNGTFATGMTREAADAACKKYNDWLEMKYHNGEICAEVREEYHEY